jgi:hypothetical protein
MSSTIPETLWYTLCFLSSRSILYYVLPKFTPIQRKVVPSICDLLGNIYMCYALYSINHDQLSLSGITRDRCDECYQSTRIPEVDSQLYLETAWYIATSMFMFIGDDFSLTMFSHHMVAIVLVRLALVENITRIGICLLPYTTVCNPFLHAAKVFHKSGHKIVAHYMFILFFSLFTVVRMILLPCVYIWSMVFVVGTHWYKDRIVTYYACVSMLSVIYGLQIFWYRKMLKMIL